MKLAPMVAAAVLLTNAGSVLAGDGPMPWPPPRQPLELAGPPPKIHLMTFEPGDRLFSAFAHSGVLVDRPGGLAMSYNFGATDFTDPLLALRVVRGDTDFWLYAEPLDETLEVYAEHDRTIITEEVRLDPEAAEYVAWALGEHALPELAIYRYDHFSDNCATRPRDILDAALGGLIRRKLETIPAEGTYRALLRSALEPHPWARLGIDLILGGRGDRPLNLWQASFLPMQLRAGLRRVHVPGSGGRLVPLLGRPIKRHVRVGPKPAARFDLVTDGLWVLTSLLALALLALAVAPPRSYALLVGPVALCVGLVGLAVWTVAAVTVNPELQHNAILLWLCPLDGWLIVPAAALARGKKKIFRAARVYTAARLASLLLFGAAHLAGILERSVWQYAWFMIVWMALCTVAFHRSGRARRSTATATS